MTFLEDVAWVKHHLIVLAITGLIVLASIYGVEHIQANARNEAAQQQAAVVAAITASNTALQASTKQQVDTLVQANLALSNQIQQLTTALAKRQVVEVNLPKQNATLSATEVATQLGGVAQGNDVVLPLSNAQSVLTAVQLVPLLQKDKEDLTASNGLLQTKVSNAEQALSLEKTAHESDNKTAKETIKGKDLDLDSCRSDARKSKMKWFGIGVVVGFIGRGFAGF